MKKPLHHCRTVRVRYRRRSNRDNDCKVGLGSFIITESIPQSWRVTEALEIGMVGVNLGLLSACESPFGSSPTSRDAEGERGRRADLLGSPEKCAQGEKRRLQSV